MNKRRSFREENIEIPINGIVLSGTLTLPPRIDSPPAVILLSGYGPKERDSEERGLKKFRIISSHLAKNGIATFRYDDRGAGNSSPVQWSDFTFYDLATEVLTIIQVLSRNQALKSSNFGLLGYSLGATIASLAASQTDEVRFLVLLGVHGLIGTETGSITRKYIGQALGESSQDSEEGMRFVSEIYDKILTDVDWEELQSNIWKKAEENYLKLSDKERRDFFSFEEYLKTTYEGFLYSEGNTPMFRSFLSYNPVKSFKRIKCPSLLLFAEQDVFHPPEKHKLTILDALSEAGNVSVTVKEFPQTSHEFTTIESRNRLEFVPNILPTIHEWILDVVDKL
jgi:pimeloyl-ACP methyl ester carboxylesterase